jgi:hypothetical protein
MPATIKIRIAEARNLPVMDNRSGLSDPYVEVRYMRRPIPQEQH